MFFNLKETKTYKKLQEVIRSKMEKCLKPIQKTEKKNVSLAAQINHKNAASWSLKLVHFEVTTLLHYISKSQL